MIKADVAYSIVQELPPSEKEVLFRMLGVAPAMSEEKGSPKLSDAEATEYLIRTIKRKKTV